MKCLALFLILSFDAALRAQLTSPPPDPLLDAGHCLASADRDWLDIGRDNPYQVELGYIDGDEWGGARGHLYLVEYTSSTHTQGFAYAFLTHGKSPHGVRLLEFRTRFRQTDDGSEQVSLVDPPLGGIGTQDEILSAIKQVGFHTWTIPVADLRNHSGNVQCESPPPIE